MIKAGGQAPSSARSRRGYTLALLVTVFASAHVDRQIVAILMEPIKRELSLSDGQVGFLAGSFAVSYALLGLPFALLADRGNRRNLIALSTAVWSVMTVLCGTAMSYTQLVVARIGVGVGEAGSTPASHSIIGDLYAQRERGRAMGIYSSAISIGILLGLLIGGWVSQWYGWRAALMVAGLPGLALALLVRLSMPEPARQKAAPGPNAHTPADTPGLAQTLATIARVPSLRYIMLAHIVTVAMLYGIGTWQPSFLARTYHMTGGQIGSVLGPIAGVFGCIGSFAGGFMADHLVRRDTRWYNWLPVIGTLVTVLAIAGVLSGAGIGVVVGLYMIWTFWQSVYLAPDYAAIQSLIPQRSRAMVIAILLLFSNLLGYGLGTYVVGVLSDAFRPWAGAESLRYALAAMLGLSLVSVAFYLLASRTIRQDQKQAAAG